jgi:hypothetical protein
MRMRRPLVLEPERSALLNVVVQEAFEESLKRGMFLSVNGQEARMTIVCRVIRAIELGETDTNKLKRLALTPADVQRVAA